MMCSGADDGTRTRNLRFTKPLLYQLSYVGATGRVIPQKDPLAPGNDMAARPDGSSAAQVDGHRPAQVVSRRSGGGARRVGCASGASVAASAWAPHRSGSRTPRGSVGDRLAWCRRPSVTLVGFGTAAGRGRVGRGRRPSISTAPCASGRVGSGRRRRRRRPSRSADSGRRPHRRRAGRPPRTAGSSPATAALSEPTAPFIGIRMNSRCGGARPARGPGPRCRRRSRAARAGRSRGRSAARPPSAPTTRRPARMEVGERARQVVDRAQQQVLDRAGRRLHRGRAERRLAMGREDARRGRRRPRRCAAACPTFCGSSSESSTRMNGGSPRSAARARMSSRRREPARLDDERDALVAVEAGERRQRSALDLDDRDPQVRGVEDELLEGLRAAAARRAAGSRGGARRRPPRPGGDRRPAPRRAEGLGRRQRRTAPCQVAARPVPAARPR